jgi:hypothetical protein
MLLQLNVAHKAMWRYDSVVYIINKEEEEEEEAER